MLLRRVVPTSGKGYVNGADITDLKAANEQFLKLGYCPQHNCLFENMTGREMLTFFCRVRGVRDSDVAQYVDNCLRNSNLSDHADKKCGVYSGGNKRKLCFAIAICGNPKLTVLDEASAGIDPAARRKLWNVVTGLLKSGNTVILTTHHMEEAAHLGHRIVIMCDGKLACLGSPLHLQTAYGAGYEVAVQMKDGKAFAPVLEKLNALKRDGDFATLEQAGESYVRVGLGDVDEQGFSLADVFDLLQKEKGGDVESFSVSQSGLEEVFLALTKSRANRDVV
mmetsp:Transcript_359/g.756  ORF Transcript_359/g.756 Transcript_359/m.756 type:complete len:280 (-) Transcript_359:75-914(-)